MSSRTLGLTSVLISSELDFDDVWSEDELESARQPGPSSYQPVSTSDDARVKQLEIALDKTQAEASSLRALLRSSLKDEERDEPWIEVAGPGLPNGKGKGKGKARASRDDDSHYFDSYAENGEHLLHGKVATPARVWRA